MRFTNWRFSSHPGGEPIRTDVRHAELVHTLVRRCHPGARGTYVFADFITGKMWGYRAGDGWTPAHALGQVTGFGLSDSREIYAVTYGGGLYKVGFAAA